MNLRKTPVALAITTTAALVLVSGSAQAATKGRQLLQGRQLRQPCRVHEERHRRKPLRHLQASFAQAHQLLLNEAVPASRNRERDLVYVHA